MTIFKKAVSWAYHGEPDDEIRNTLGYTGDQAEAEDIAFKLYYGAGYSLAAIERSLERAFSMTRQFYVGSISKKISTFGHGFLSPTGGKEYDTRVV
jgi:hypothetical protein